MPAIFGRSCGLRRNGFPGVFAHDGGIPPERCGGPVVNRSGEIVGINIARADMIQTFAIPSAAARKVVAQLMDDARQTQHDPGPSDAVEVPNKAEDPSDDRCAKCQGA